MSRPRGAGIAHAELSHSPAWRLSTLTVLAGVLVAGCTTHSPKHPVAKVHLIVDVFSGRENPAWDLAEADATRFATMLSALPQDSIAPPAASEGLGYRGIHVMMHAGSASTTLRVAGGAVTFESPDSTVERTLSDPGREFEKWLLSTGREHLNPGLLRHLLGD